MWRRRIVLFRRCTASGAANAQRSGADLVSLCLESCVLRLFSAGNANAETALFYPDFVWAATPICTLVTGISPRYSAKSCDSELAEVARYIFLFKHKLTWRMTMFTKITLSAALLLFAVGAVWVGSRTSFASGAKDQVATKANACQLVGDCCAKGGCCPDGGCCCKDGSCNCAVCECACEGNACCSGAAAAKTSNVKATTKEAKCGSCCKI